MKSLLAFLLAFLCVILLHPAAYTQYCGSYDECEIWRGDADCDGDTDMTDVLAILYSTYSNEDAADVDDNGVVDSNVDSTKLYNYLFSSGPPPEEPYSSGPGFDCSPDNLETCCSQPIGYITSSGYSVSDDFNDWDEQWTNTPNLISISENPDDDPESCERDYCTDEWSYFESISDGYGMTYHRVHSWQQPVTLMVEVSVSFEIGDKCSSCNEGTNTMYVDLSDATVDLVIDNGEDADQVTVAGPGISWVGGDTLSVTYEQDDTQQGCPIVKTNGAWNDSSYKVFSTEVTNALLNSSLLDDCDDVDITFAVLQGVYVSFDPGFDDELVDSERATIDVDFTLEYSFCE